VRNSSLVEWRCADNVRGSSVKPKLRLSRRWTLDIGYWIKEVISLSKYKELEVYQKAYQYSLEIHKLTVAFPKHEMYEIGSQMRRAAISIPLNIAEGYGRKLHQNTFKSFLINALGSCNEIAVLLDLAKDLGYITEQYETLYKNYDQLGRQLNKFIQSIQ